MKRELEKLWNEHFAEVCAAIDTEEEKEHIKRAAALHDALNNCLTKEQHNAVEEYLDAASDMQAASIKKAFLLGCKFAASFLLETGFSLSP